MLLKYGVAAELHAKVDSASVWSPSRVQPHMMHVGAVAGDQLDHVVRLMRRAVRTFVAFQQRDGCAVLDQNENARRGRNGAVARCDEAQMNRLFDWARAMRSITPSAMKDELSW